MQLGRRADLYVLLFGHSAMVPTKEQHQILCKSRNKCHKDPGNDQTSIWGKSMSRTQNVQTYQDRKRRDRWRAKSRARSLFSFTSRGLLKTNSSWKAKQPIPHITVMFYDECVKMCQDFAPNFRDKRIYCCITTTDRLILPFSQRNFFTKNIMTLVPHPPTFLCFPHWR
jgi:hypothetical protein